MDIKHIKCICIQMIILRLKTEMELNSKGFTNPFSIQIGTLTGIAKGMRHVTRKSVLRCAGRQFCKVSNRYSRI
jgi:hypothetical protein